MRSRFGQQFEKVPSIKRGANSKFMLEFEAAKRDFGTFENGLKMEFHLKMDVTGSDYYDEDDQAISLTT